jgi:hypothetical protein
MLWSVSQNGKSHMEDLGIGGRIVTMKWGVCGLDSFDSRYIPVAGCCDHDNAIFESV